MENRGLLFIPDISGFTRFVNQTEIEHSRLIIQELLETIINANQTDLQISEIEGDAILFYRFGNPPALEEIYKQVEKMFCSFHKNLIAYEFRRYCQCKACISAIDLSLKIITHYGEFTGYSVQNFNKLIGKDIIVAHQLLKNDIKQHEYWLVTKSLSHDSQPSGFAQWMEWNSSAKQTDSGEVGFHFTQLSPLKDQIEKDPFPKVDFSNKRKVITASKEYDTGLITLFHAAGDLNFRSDWQVGVKKVEEINHILPRIGMRARTILENGETSLYSSSYFYQPDRIEFSETDETTKNITYYTLEKISDTRTRLTLDYYVKKGLHAQISFNLFKKKHMEVDIKKSLLNLVELAKTIKLP